VANLPSVEVISDASVVGISGASVVVMSGAGNEKNER